MSNVIFDCSQFLSFSFTDGIYKHEVERFERLGMKVLLKEEISKKKLNYLRSVLQEEVLELFNQEFIGLFEDWKEEGNPPIELYNLKEELSEFQRSSR
ncbi:hypothetical protein KDC22_09855 [Paenibacillus tritici]|uniref:hypothetical protein n=1 Tax=Paenibacillus tritici TaxID=1873425 RepID=UPI001BA55EC6|nr:hypothetical protein [Paenibacillus tritici]QUL56752.1 hypothetical protein KDC22_09855 [Paenibacillus tritici]